MSSAESSSRRRFLKIGLGVAAGAAIVSVADVKFDPKDERDEKIAALEQQLDATNRVREQELGLLQGQVSQLSAANQDLQTQLTTIRGLTTLSTDEATILEAALELIIPTDSSGPGAQTAGVIYFIDGQLHGEYGTSGAMYMQGPFVLPGLQGTITVEGVTYPHGSPSHAVTAGTHYQYSMNLRYFWRYGLDALQSYASTAYGGSFENLSAADQRSVLTDLWNDKPLSFNGIVPSDFAWELFFMAWAGFLTDPLYGGNQNMVGWELVGFNGTNMGDFYGEGHSPLALALSTTPIALKPASLAQFQKATPIL